MSPDAQIAAFIAAHGVTRCPPAAVAAIGASANQVVNPGGNRRRPGRGEAWRANHAAAMQRMWANPHFRDRHKRALQAMHARRRQERSS